MLQALAANADTYMLSRKHMHVQHTHALIPNANARTYAAGCLKKIQRLYRQTFCNNTRGMPKLN